MKPSTPKIIQPSAITPGTSSECKNSTNDNEDDEGAACLQITERLNKMGGWGACQNPSSDRTSKDQLRIALASRPHSTSLDQSLKKD